MHNKTFKLSVIAASLFAANSATAAIYNIVKVSPNISANQSYSSAISESTTPVSSSNPLGCFGEDCAQGTDYHLGGDTRNGTDGFSYRDEVPFRLDSTFTYLDQDDLEVYCYNQLGYSTCESWANQQWFGGQSDNNSDDCDDNYQGGLCHERRAFYQGYNGRNAAAFIDGTEIIPPKEVSYTPPNSTLVDNSANTVINKVLQDGTAIGIASSGYYTVGDNEVLTYRQRGFYDTTFMLPKQDGETIVKQMGRTFAFDSFDYNGKTYVVGSASIEPFNNDDDDKNYFGDLSQCTDTTNNPDPVLLPDCQNFAFATQAYVWDSSNGASGLAATGWSGQTDANDDDTAAEGSARTSVIAEDSNSLYKGKPVLGGFNTYRDDDNLLMQAAIFYPIDGFDITKENQWQTAFVKGAEIEQGDDYIYSNSLVKDINEHLIAIGETKRRGDAPENGAANNRLFYTDASKGSASSPPTAVYLTGDIFFSGAGGEANAINNYNEVVGSIDAEDDREVDGKQRRRRGFIDPLNLSGTNADRLAIFQGKSWWLDNLTNDGNATGNNNQYRIVNATGINDDGVISATANFCEGGYDDVANDSFCGGGTGVETLVSVKLVPISGATSDDIVLRKSDSQNVERSGGSIGYFALTLLGLIGFRRRKNKM
ncbi:DUF3466 family protein [Vibrio rumoiensis]|uniref:GlyGly-CTERM sorting domain-containing protein n=1 Tax=Vibrio rumoiensis 1S-45 TaxID=1188252 RepID=A0A1E5E7B3_9VIBR|nr:DUF3466 family protein [Vibrio rumoiensis]OEF30199.1 hypothetical protein A1QC_00520 [Vibrio rumoiensis 1S-45]